MRRILMVLIVLVITAALLVLFFPALVKGSWMKSISAAESKWHASGINTYQLIGQANWGWHEHTFQITVIDGQIVQARCDLGYDRLVGESWCETQFEASAHLVPALYNQAREMLEFGTDISPRGNCFEAEFDKVSGAPKRLLIDCADADDEQEEWKVTVSEYVP